MQKIKKKYGPNKSAFYFIQSLKFIQFKVWERFNMIVIIYFLASNWSQNHSE